MPPVLMWLVQFIWQGNSKKRGLSATAFGVKCLRCGLVWKPARTTVAKDRHRDLRLLEQIDRLSALGGRGGHFIVSPDTIGFAADGVDGC